MSSAQRAAGAVIYLIEERPLYLVLHNRLGWDFPHGLIRQNETEEAAALREIYEETHLKVEFVPGFRENVFLRFSRGGRTIYKEIVMYLAKAAGGEVILSSEHDDYAWLDYADALLRLSRDEMRRVLIKANSFIERLLIRAR
ncbi:bis(5'-nucleosyl)-tetraphosphatase [Thermoproteus tenax]|uniref:Bis(5'-nucleosyl)-tetraphosphatase [asymmetrical] n=1 Tax=Thermoproteus tenax (strain ATCC 35583 / DSM 2078 / JCM 9277 / NBRC 100435 / Kra 1) TaxID=768679 RepID=G4RPM0_THETK|nr:NUDIX domain-containing protein [Thermoproteus tenax]CCC81515.1 diadenosine 5'5'''-P1,P4-tetraphosphate pyrophosphohydrolase (mutT/nudix family protein) [Thermoproteus tenax Kra 1]